MGGLEVSDRRQDAVLESELARGPGVEGKRRLEPEGGWQHRYPEPTRRSTSTILCLLGSIVDYELVYCVSLLLRAEVLPQLREWDPLQEGILSSHMVCMQCCATSGTLGE